MLSKLFKAIVVLILAVGIVSFSSNSASAAKVMWGKTELKLGQIGKVTILSNTNLVKMESNGSLTTVRSMKKGEEYRVYSYKTNHGGLYGVGGGSYIQKSTNVKYETPSKSKLASLKGSSLIPTYEEWLNSKEATNYEPSSPSNTDYKVKNELILIAQDGQYLGKLITDKYDDESIFNQYGDYGSKYSDTSIWNKYSEYGSKYGTYSAFNKRSPSPPVIFDGKEAIGYLTVDFDKKGAIHPDLLHALLEELGL
ncbi:hypothetical protein [Bacillus sp. Cr_A10]|uniref:hypothetical protein n=1 Tax=Bacillus sp. Cr_A10 TaxID=3033993 RepID=UPI0023D9D115|nr:hypothetical protein [Bacillus sp. Cr_A10]MDF2068016.1 hypothetical protein [Bacillus sp. Cr_A10]